MLAVVEDQHQLSPGEVTDEDLGGSMGGGTAGDAEAQCVRDRVHDPVGLGDGRQRNQPRAVGVVIGGGAGCLDREAGLARAARSGEGNQPGRGELLEGAGQVVVTADEGR